jgi:hypothetical protein
LILHEATAVLPVIGFYFLFSSLGTGLGIVEWLNRTTGEGGEEVVGEEGERGWKGVVKSWYDEGQAKVGRVGRRYGLWQDEGSTIKAGEGVANAVAAYVVVKVSQLHQSRQEMSLRAGSITSEDRCFHRRRTSLCEVGFRTNKKSGY